MGMCGPVCKGALSCPCGSLISHPIDVAEPGALFAQFPGALTLYAAVGGVSWLDIGVGCPLFAWVVAVSDACRVGGDKLEPRW